MRSQATKTLPKKGALVKTVFKGNSASKSAKKKGGAPKRAKTLQKSVSKCPKKNIQKDEASTSKSDTTVPIEEKSDLSSDTPKAETSKASQSRSSSPAKKLKKESKEKKDAAKNTTSAANPVIVKKHIRAKKTKPITKDDKAEKKIQDVKYKINLDAAKKPAPSKVKPMNKKVANAKKKGINVTKSETAVIEKAVGESKNIEKSNDSKDKQKPTIIKEPIPNTSNEKKDEAKVQCNVESKSNIYNATLKGPSCSTSSGQEACKSESDRPPKFFTSVRPPRTVDIDVKCCKYSKGNINASERFLTMKCETKNDEYNKEKKSSNHLVSQGAEIDVYTFTDKVDSPKSILSDFRNTTNKSVGRVRPIARVKGTVIDKKTDSERKKFSPHRPIEEVVKQLKANKRSEEITLSNKPSSDPLSGSDSNTNSNEKDVGDNPQPIVSKSYKMVARKSSITGKPFSPIKFFEQDEATSPKNDATPSTDKGAPKQQATKKLQKKSSMSEEDIDNSKFSINKKSDNETSSEESLNESNDDNESKESSGSDTSTSKKAKTKKFKRITDSMRKPTSKELKELSKDSLTDLKDNFSLLCNDKPSKRRLKLLSMWTGPKKHRMASLNAIAKVHCLYENESRTHMELGLMKTIDRQPIPSTSKMSTVKKKETKSKETDKQDSASESEYEVKKDKKDESSESSDDNLPQRILRGVPGIRSAGKYWDPKSSSSSEESEIEIKTKTTVPEKKKVIPKPIVKSDGEKPLKMKKTTGVLVKKKRNRNEVVMDLKDMVVQKRMASLNATAILAASYEKRSSKSSKDDSTSDSCSDESFTHKLKNVPTASVKSEVKHEDTKKEVEDSPLSDNKQKVEVIVNQDTDVTITGVYSTHHHEGFCTVSGMQYRISSTSHTQTTATANCEKDGCPREDGSRYTPLSALSSMQPPAEHTHAHSHPVPELGGLGRRAGCSSAFSAPSPSAHHDPGYYQPAGPLIKENSAEAERTLGRYHPAPHYHPPHPSVLPQYGPPYYPAELCYGRYYRPPGPYHIPPPQADAQMVGVGGEPYPPPQYYGTPPCYQHSPQRIPYVEYRGCPCPLNACPKNVHIGPATGKAPTGAGPADALALAPPGGSLRQKVRSCALDANPDTHGSGKDPPLEPEPPAAADAPHPCPLPAIGGASPKREIYDVRDNLRMAADIPGPAEALGPPSPARGSAGACAPQPPPTAPRRARLGKAMVRKTLAGDDTGLLLTVPLPPAHTDTDDDVLAISPPICAPIDLSSSDERSTPLVDVKKENEGPTYTTPRKADAQALREHNSATTTDVPETDAGKAVKRRYSKPKLEIDLRDIQLDDTCKTNGIGEHVKLQKRRKVSGDQAEVMRAETITKESKKKTTSSIKRVPRSPPAEKKSLKRKLENSVSGLKVKKALIETIINEDPRIKNVAAVTDEPFIKKPKTKSALLLDNLIRKNSIDGKGYSSDTELNPADLFLPPNENVVQNCPKKTLNNNNNIVDNNTPVNGVRPKTIEAVSQLIEKKLAYKNACKIDSNITHNIKSVLKSPTDSTDFKEEIKVLPSSELLSDNKAVATDKCKTNTVEDKCDSIKDIVSDNKNNDKSEDDPKSIKVLKTNKTKSEDNQMELNAHSVIAANLEESQCIPNKLQTQGEITPDLLVTDKTPSKKHKTVVEKTNVEIKGKNVEKVVKLLVSKKQAKKSDEVPESSIEKVDEKTVEKAKPEKVKRCKLAMDKESKGKNVDKLAKLLVSKKTALKTDEATLVVEDMCASPTPNLVESGRIEVTPGIGMGGRRTRRRRSGIRKRRQPPPLSLPALQPRPPPRWSNGWNWEGEHYISKVYLNNDSRLDLTARCWARMWHESGDRVARGDCVLLRASPARAKPFVARVASLWENPTDGEMMVSLVWYYRPEHTEQKELQAEDAPDEVFASRHRDANSVACIEDKCYVLTFNEYCRYRKRLKAAEEGIKIGPSIVPPMPASEVTSPSLVPNDTKLPPSVSPELVLFCRKIYDFRSKKIHMPNK